MIKSIQNEVFIFYSGPSRRHSHYLKRKAGKNMYTDNTKPFSQ